MRRRRTTAGWLCIAGAGVCAWALSDDCEAHRRYWKALNEGRPVNRIQSIVEQLVFPALRKKNQDELIQEAARALSSIEKCAPEGSVSGGVAATPFSPGADWPSLGGSPLHCGAAAGRGPRQGREVWRVAVGWEWDAPATIREGRVFIASPGSDAVMRCFDRRTGKELWVARRKRAEFVRGVRAGSKITFLPDGLAVVIGYGAGGDAQDVILVDPARGLVKDRIQVEPSERTFAHVVPKGEPLFAMRTRDRRGVILKLLPSGRTWWRFSTGRLSGEPAMIDGLALAPDDGGVLWALKVSGEQRVAWTYRIGAAWRSAPAVVNGTLYIGANDGKVYAIEAATGALRWSNAVSGGEPRAYQLFSGAAVSGGRVYIGAADGKLSAIEASTGKVCWQAAVGDWIRARPFVHGSLVAVATLGGEVAAYRDTGREAVLLWRKKIGRHGVFSDLTGDSAGVLAASNDLFLTALNWRDGSVEWRNRFVERTDHGEDTALGDSPPQLMQAPVIVASGKVFAAGPDHIVRAVDATSGRELWRFEASGRIAAAPTAHQGKVFVGSYTGDGVLAAVDIFTGRPLWKRDLGRVWASPECHGGRVYVGTTDGSLFCLRAGDGSELWRRRFGGGVYSAPAVDDHAVYTGSWDGHYYALDPNDGHVLWAWSPPGWPYQAGGRPDSGAPAVVGDKVIVPALGSRFVALEAHTGTKVWEWVAPPWRIANVTPAAAMGLVWVSVFGNAYEWPFGAHLYALDAQTGQMLWDLPDAGGLAAPVVAKDGLLLCGSLSRPFLSAYQMDLRRNQRPVLLWRLQTGGVTMESHPALSGDLGFFLTQDGWLRAIR